MGGLVLEVERDARRAGQRHAQEWVSAERLKSASIMRTASSTARTACQCCFPRAMTSTAERFEREAQTATTNAFEYFANSRSEFYGPWAEFRSGKADAAPSAAHTQAHDRHT